MAGNNNTKQLRNYVLTVAVPLNTAQGLPPNSPIQRSVVIASPQPNTIPNPYTIEFNIVKDPGSTGSATFRVYNLSQKTRTRILKDVTNQSGFQFIEFRAGYGLGINFPVVFSGYVSSCTSTREGTNVITTIDCHNFELQSDAMNYDGGPISGSNNAAIGQVIDNALSNAQSSAIQNNSGIPILSVGAIGDFGGTPPSGQSHSGNIVDIINQIAGAGSSPICYIDDNKIHALSRNQFVTNPTLPLISAATGLLNSPHRGEHTFTLDLLFEPRVKLNQEVAVFSLVNPYINGGSYKICKIAHKGIISPVVSGEAVTSVDFFVLNPAALDYQNVLSL